MGQKHLGYKYFILYFIFQPDIKTECVIKITNKTNFQLNKKSANVDLGNSISKNDVIHEALKVIRNKNPNRPGKSAMLALSAIWAVKSIQL